MRKLVMLLVLAMIFISGCTLPGSGKTSVSKNNGVDLQKLSLDRGSVESGDEISLSASFQNVGEKTATDVHLFVIGPSFTTEQCSGNPNSFCLTDAGNGGEIDDSKGSILIWTSDDIGTMEAAPKDQDPFPATANVWSFGVPCLAYGTSNSYSLTGRLCYRYSTEAVASVIVMPQSEKVTSGGDFGKVKTSNTAGPIQMEVKTRNPVVIYEGEREERVSIVIKNVGPGKVFAGNDDFSCENPLPDISQIGRVKITAPGLDCGEGEGGSVSIKLLPDQNQVTLNCKGKIGTAVTKQQHDFHVTAEYGYYVEKETTLQVKGVEFAGDVCGYEGITGSIGGGGGAGKPPKYKNVIFSQGVLDLYSSIEDESGEPKDLKLTLDKVYPEEQPVTTEILSLQDGTVPAVKSKSVFIVLGDPGDKIKLNGVGCDYNDNELKCGDISGNLRLDKITIGCKNVISVNGDIDFPKGLQKPAKYALCPVQQYNKEKGKFENNVVTLTSAFSIREYRHGKDEPIKIRLPVEVYEGADKVKTYHEEITMKYHFSYFDTSERVDVKQWYADINKVEDISVTDGSEVDDYKITLKAYVRDVKYNNKDVSSCEPEFLISVESSGQVEDIKYNQDKWELNTESDMYSYKGSFSGLKTKKKLLSYEFDGDSGYPVDMYVELDQADCSNAEKCGDCYYKFRFSFDMPPIEPY